MIRQRKNVNLGGHTLTNSRYRDSKQTNAYLCPGTDVMIFLNIFAENFCEKIGVFDSKQS
jgi:hypothetical protein